MNNLQTNPQPSTGGTSLIKKACHDIRGDLQIAMTAFQLIEEGGGKQASVAKLALRALNAATEKVNSLSASSPSLKT